MIVRIIYLLALRIKKKNNIINICILFLIIFIIFNCIKIYFLNEEIYHCSII